jgi:hypothetical protein
VIGVTLFPRTVNSRPTGFKIRHIASDYRKVILQGGGSEQSIRVRCSAYRKQASPSIRNAKCDGKNVGRKHDELLCKPFLERDGLSQISQPTIFDSTSDFPNSDDTQSALHGIVSQRPCKDTSVCAILLPHLGDEIGIQQKAHQNSVRVPFPDFRFLSNSKSGAILPNSKKASNRVFGFSATTGIVSGTCPRAEMWSLKLSGIAWSLRGGIALRGSFRSKSQSFASSASPVPGTDNKLLIFDSFALLSAPAIASAKIRRCSSSAETPCSAARSFNDLTNDSEIFLTSN